jgi:cytochrome c peroxidase
MQRECSNLEHGGGHNTMLTISTRLALLAGLVTALSCTSDAGALETEVDAPPISQALSGSGDPYIGALVFFDEFPETEGNGRACATCHVAADAFQLTPARVERQWQLLQAKKCDDPDADDPLFRSLDADDQAEDFTLLREHALVSVTIPLPTDDDGNKLVWPVDDPDATSVVLFRATPSIRNVALTAPYQYDARFATLQAQAKGALFGHAEIQRKPKARFLDDVAAFEKTVFSSPDVAALTDAIDHGRQPPNIDPPLNALEQHGKKIFDRVCAVCHGGPKQTQPVPELDSIVGLRDIFLSKPVPDFAAGFPFHPSPVQNKLRRWAVRVPGQEKPEIRPSTDPGKVLQTGSLANWNEFDIPSLYGISDTAPYFRDNSAATLRDVVRHYQLLNQALFVVIPPETPFPARPDAILDSDFEPLIAYLEKI